MGHQVYCRREGGRCIGGGERIGAGGGALRIVDGVDGSIDDLRTGAELRLTGARCCDDGTRLAELFGRAYGLMKLLRDACCCRYHFADSGAWMVSRRTSAERDARSCWARLSRNSLES